MALPAHGPRRITFKDIGAEPFRVFFPQGVLAGILGVALWPLYFGGATSFYPGEGHPRLMTYGMFGGFIFGFLGTALPRLLSLPPLGAPSVVLLAVIHLVMVIVLIDHQILLGDSLFFALLLTFGVLLARRLRHRKDTPPPGFTLVGLGLLCALVGIIIALFQPWNEEGNIRWVALQRLFSYQGFILLPILGVGPFILPRLFGLPSPHAFPEMMWPETQWKRKAVLAAGSGILIVASFFIEAEGWFRTAYAIRCAVTLIYLVVEFPFRRAPNATNSLGAALPIAFTAMAGGFMFIALFPVFRVSLIHLTLIGGFAVISFTVATRVVFGHSGNLEKLKSHNWWLVGALALMLFGMATRISGDFWPRILASHYFYGALIWIGGVLLWSSYVLPKVMKVETE